MGQLTTRFQQFIEMYSKGLELKGLIKDFEKREKCKELIGEINHIACDAYDAGEDRIDIINLYNAIFKADFGDDYKKNIEELLRQVEIIVESVKKDRDEKLAYIVSDGDVDDDCKDIDEETTNKELLTIVMASKVLDLKKILVNSCIKQEKESLFRWLVVNNLLSAEDLTSAHSNSWLKKTLVDTCIEQENKDLFRGLLRNNLLSKEDLAFARSCSALKKILDYKLKRNKAVSENYYSVEEYYLLPKKEVDPGAFKRRLDDECNTSDEDSSDSDCDEPVIIEKEHSRANSLNDQMLFRGMNYSPKFFNKQERRLAKTEEYHKKRACSFATKKHGEKKKNLNPDNSSNYEKGDEIVKGFFETLKITPDKTERYSSNKINYNRPVIEGRSLFVHLVQAYINSYDELFKKGGMTRNFNADSNDNPFVSTSKIIKDAAEYSWNRIQEESRFYPKLRKSTGEFKHTRFGYLHVYAVASEYSDKYGIDMDKLKTDGKIKVSHFHQFGQEVAFESSIPGEYVLGYQIFSIPKFNKDWDRTIEEKYGLNKEKYTSCQDELIKYAENSGQIKKLIDGIVRIVISHQVELLQDQIKLVKQEKQVRVKSGEVVTPLRPPRHEIRPH